MNLRGASLAALAMACTSEPPPPAPTPSEPLVYRVVRDTDGEHFIGEADAPAVRWEGRRVVGPERSVKALKRRNKLGELLNACVGDPMALPPADDPGGFRKLVWDEVPYWRVDLSGMNRCSLSGWIELDVARDSVPRSALVVDGLPWREGGAEKAREILDAALRAEAATLWPTLDLEARVLVLKRLSELADGDEALAKLEALGGPNQAEIRAARGRWRARFEADDPN